MFTECRACPLCASWPLFRIHPINSNLMAADWASTAAIVSEIRMSAGHDHGVEGMSDARLVWAVTVNMGLTVVQIVGGTLAGSLAFVADALHNFSHASSSGPALLAPQYARRPSRNPTRSPF